ncbi:MAG: GDSL-type esterase/lipase family protein [Clostridia bacterium]|nr:GDSL-type esterase/lipase family protein [Clostridia bacterium]
MKTVLCYGDSNTYGYEPTTCGRYPKDKRWVGILQRKLGEDYDVISEGLNGRTTAFDREGRAWKNGLYPLTAIMGSHVPLDYIIFMLGTNDCEMGLSLDHPVWGMEQVLKQAEANIAEMQDYKAKIILVVPPAMGDKYEESHSMNVLTFEMVQNTRSLAKPYKELAEKYNCIFLDASSLEVTDYDSEHLSLKGHEELADLLLEKILGE